MSVVSAIGIVPPWLGGDVPRAWDEAWLPVLPSPPCPPDWDVVFASEVISDWHLPMLAWEYGFRMPDVGDLHYDHGDPGTFDPDLSDEDGRDQ